MPFPILTRRIIHGLHPLIDVDGRDIIPSAQFFNANI